MDLIKEAKRRYPVGTKFFPAHLDCYSGEYCTVIDQNFRKEGENCISAPLPNGDLHDVYNVYDGGYNPKYGNNNFNRHLFYFGKWAKIISKPSKTYELW